MINYWEPRGENSSNPSVHTWIVYLQLQREYLEMLAKLKR